MLLNHEHKVVLLKATNQLHTLLPRARMINHRGTDVLIVPHRLDETLVLNNLGYKVPSPVRTQYDWPGRYKPFNVQRHTVEFLTINPRAFVLNDLGTGKTISCIWAADYLLRARKIRRVLVVTPLSTMRPVWLDEIKKHFLRYQVAVLHGDAAKRRRLLAQPHHFYIINHDGIKVVEQDLLRRRDIDLVIVDECARFRQHTTDKWDVLKDIVARAKYVWMLTAAPTPNAPTDGYGQVRLLWPERVPRSFKAFQELVMWRVSQYRWIPKTMKYHGIDGYQTVRDLMQPAIRFTRDECVDLPPCSYITLDAPLSPEQKHAYDKMRSQFIAELAAGQKITAVNEGVKRIKLLQILAGSIKDGFGQVHQLDCRPRVQVLHEAIEQAPAKVIVFAHFTGSVDHLYATLSKHFKCARIYGATPKGERDRVFRAFQNTDEVRVIVAHCGTMSHGLTLTEAATVIWYTPTDPEHYEQANGRITRPGQKRAQTIIHIESTAFERDLYKRLREKLSLQGALLQALQQNSSQHLF